MHEERTAGNIFERFAAEREYEILPDIDLLMEVGIRNSKWQTFTGEEKLTLSDTLAQMERANGGIRNNIHLLTSGKHSATKWEDRENEEPFEPNLEALKVVHQMISQGRLARIPQIANFIEKFTGETVIGK